MILEGTTKNVTIAVSVFACALLVSAFTVTNVYAGAHYDVGEKLKGFTYNHKKQVKVKQKKHAILWIKMMNALNVLSIEPTSRD